MPRRRKLFRAPALAHSGKIGGGRAGIGKVAFLSNLGDADLVSVSFPGGEQWDYVIVGRVNDPNLRARLANFVHTAARFKQDAVGTA
jgi:hypothetical protein